MLSIIENMTGIMPEEDSTLDEVGLASVGIPVLVARINSSLSTKNLSTRSLSITAVDLMRCKTIEDIGECVCVFFFIQHSKIDIFVMLSLFLIVDLVEDVRDHMENDGV